MTLTPEQIAQLNVPLDTKRISVRKDKGIALDYLETFDVIDSANAIFGYAGWGYEVKRLEQVASGTYDSTNGPKPWALFEAEVRAWVLGDTGFSISRTDVGHGIARPADSVDTLEMQRKGAVSDALKRALRSFGNQFGNSLYDKDHDRGATAGVVGRPTLRQADSPTASTPPAPPSGDAPCCTVCGLEMAYREGINKAGKPYKGFFCPERDCKGKPVWIDAGVRKLASPRTAPFPAQIDFLTKLLNEVDEGVALLKAEKYDLEVGYRQTPEGETEMFISGHHLTNESAKALSDELIAEKKKV